MSVGQGRGGVAEGSVAGLPQALTTGVREGKTAEQIVSKGHGKYYEAASRGAMFSAANSTPVAMTTALSTTCPFTLYNPIGSGKNLVIKRVGFAQGATASSVQGTGGLFHCVYTIKGPVASQSGTAPTGTAVVPINNLIGSSVASVATPLSGVTLNAAPVSLAVFANLSEVTVGTIADNTVRTFEDVDGAIVLEPGTGWAPQAITAAGTFVSTPAQTGLFSVTWEEVNPT